MARVTINKDFKKVTIVAEEDEKFSTWFSKHSKDKDKEIRLIVLCFEKIKQTKGERNV